MLIYANMLLMAAIILLALDIFIFFSGFSVRKYHWEFFLLGICICFGAAAISLYLGGDSFSRSLFGMRWAETMMSFLYPLLTLYYMRYICGKNKMGETALTIQLFCAVIFSFFIITDNIFVLSEVDGTIVYHAVVSPVLIAYIIYNLGSLFAIIYMLFRVFKEARYKREKMISGSGMILTFIVTGATIRFFYPFCYAIIPGFAVLVFSVLYYYTVRVSIYTISQANASQYLYSAIDTPFLFVSSELEVMLYNKSSLSFFGKTKSEMKRIHVKELFYIKDLCHVEESFTCSQKIEKPESNGKRYEAITKETNIKCTVSVTHVSDQYGECLCAIFIISDISDKEALIEALTLEKENAELANKAKSTFLANTSHEIRTPMNAIIGMTELVLMEENLTSSSREELLSIKSAGANLLSIINDLLDISKIESGKMEILPVNYLVPSMIHDVTSIIKTRISEKPILFTVFVDSNLPNELYGDEIRIRQIIMNVLNNAVKYTKEGSVVLEITFRELEADSIMLEVRVGDTGNGIKEEDLNTIFQDFVQTNMVLNRNIEGTGLGLAISNRLCRAMGGEITVESVYGEGSVFTIRVPQKVVASDKFASISEPGKHQILIYELQDIYNASTARSMENLQLSYKIVKSQSAFIEELQNSNYTYVFVPELLFDGAKKMISKLDSHVKLVLITNTNAITVGDNIKTITAPVHALSIANVLNDVNSDISYSNTADTYVGFMAPTAKVLVVDDIETNLKVVTGLMRPYQMQVTTCKSGAEAVALAKQNEYDLIFMDHMMPLMDGIEATYAIRRIDAGNPYYKELPIIALTANAVSGVKEMFLENEMNDYLAKPIEIIRLNQILEHWIPKEKQENYSDIKVERSEVFIEIPGLDIKSGIQVSGVMMKDYLEILDIYQKDGREKLIQLEDCIHSKNFELYTMYIHALKSASASIGAARLSKIAKALEFAGNTEDYDYIYKNHGKFMEGLRDLLENIGQFFERHQEGEENQKQQQGNEALLFENLKKIKQALTEFEINEVDEALNLLQSCTWSVELTEFIGEIAQRVLLFDYDGAVELMDQELERL